MISKELYSGNNLAIKILIFMYIQSFFFVQIILRGIYLCVKTIYFDLINELYLTIPEKKKKSCFLIN